MALTNLDLILPNLGSSPPVSPLGDIVSWSITEPTTPHNPHTHNGSTGTASVTAKATTDTFWTISEDATITVDGLEGSFEGTIDSTRIQPFNEHGDPSGATTFSVASVLNLLNAERTLPPVLNTPLSDVVTQYVAAVTPNLTVNWLATTNPTRTYGAWSGNVWTILKTLCAANKLEIALNGGMMIVRDLGAQTVRFDDPTHPGFDVENVSLSVTPGTGQFIEITYQDSTPINNEASYNYVSNPSVEVDATGFGVRTLSNGAIQGSRVSN